MEESLLNKVDVAKLDALNDALIDVMQDMKSGMDRNEYLRDEDYAAMLSLNLRVFEAIKARVLGKQQMPTQCETYN